MLWDGSPEGRGGWKASGMRQDAGGGDDRLPDTAPASPLLAGDVREIKSQQETRASRRVTEAAAEAAVMRLPGPLPPGSGCPENATRSRGALPASDAGSAFP